MIRICDLKKKFGTKEVLRGVDLIIPKGETTVILGLSGSGKSTIIKHLVGLLRADSGEIWVDGHEICRADEKTLREIRKKIGFLFQSGALFDSMNVFENVAFPLREHTSMGEKKIIERVRKLLEMVGLRPDEVLNLYPDALSGGMRKRVGLARTLAMDPEIVLYDEPTSGLDPITSDHISQMIMHLQKTLGITSVLISHDIKESFKCGNHFAFLYQGKIIEHGEAEAMRNSTDLCLRQFLHGESEGPIGLMN